MGIGRRSQFSLPRPGSEQSEAKPPLTWVWCSRWGVGVPEAGAKDWEPAFTDAYMSVGGRESKEAPRSSLLSSLPPEDGDVFMLWWSWQQAWNYRTQLFFLR